MSARTDVLITVPELNELLTASSGAHVLDVRWKLGGPPGREEYRVGHIPGAVYVDLDEELAAPAGPEVGRHPLPSLADLTAAARSWGLREGEPVVVYDDNGNQSAARAWWLLRWAGVRDVRLLDGALAAWRSAGLPLATGDETPKPGDLDLVPGALPILEINEIESFVGGAGLLLDARARDRYRGEVASVDPRPGHIPGAASLPTSENLTSSGTFRSTEELAARFAAAGVTAGRATAVYCGSGVTAAHELAALAVAGIDDVALYPGSYSQWASDPERPVTLEGLAPQALVPAADAHRRVEAGALLIDVRSPGGREKGGAIDGAEIVDKADVDARFADVPPQTPVVVVCGSIHGSGPVAEKLLARGFVNVVHVAGGAQAWHTTT